MSEKANTQLFIKAYSLKYRELMGLPNSGKEIRITRKNRQFIENAVSKAQINAEIQKRHDEYISKQDPPAPAQNDFSLN